jgi:hypothetical protein
MKLSKTLMPVLRMHPPGAVPFRRSIVIMHCVIGVGIDELLSGNLQVSHSQQHKENERDCEQHEDVGFGQGRGSS